MTLTYPSFVAGNDCAPGEVLTAAEVNHMCQEYVKALDGYNGGTYNLLNALHLTGAGFSCTGPFIVNGASGSLFNGDVLLSNNLRVIGTTRLDGYTNQQGASFHLGDATFYNTEHKGNLHVQSTATMQVDGATGFYGILSVNGSSVFNDVQSFNANSTFNQVATFNAATKYLTQQGLDADHTYDVANGSIIMVGQDGGAFTLSADRNYTLSNASDGNSIEIINYSATHLIQVYVAGTNIFTCPLGKATVSGVSVVASGRIIPGRLKLTYCYDGVGSSRWNLTDYTKP
jgi:hypothetical protein